MTAIELIESARLTKASVDRTAGVIKGVRLLGERADSKNRSYDVAAMRRAVPMYEGKPVNIDHGKSPRNLRDRFGKVMNASFDESQKAIVGDIQYNRKHPLAEQVAEAADTMPDTLGCSHIAEGQVTRAGGREIVTAIVEVRSVDLVSDPATNKSLYESVGAEPNGRNNGATKMLLAEAKIEDLKTSRPDLFAKALEEAKAELAESEQQKALLEENKSLKAKLDAATAKEALAAHQTLIATKLAEAKLPAALVTDTFKAQLAEAKDGAAIDALIADRKAIAKTVVVKSTVQTVSESRTSGSKSLKEMDAKEAAKAFGF